jgi:P2-related tail formation protein
LEWQAEATVERSRKSILRAIELRFRAPVPDDLTAAVTALTDLDELSRWFDATQTSDNLDTFRAAIASGGATLDNGV